MFRAKQLHGVLVLAREQFNLDVIQRYLQGRQCIFKDVSGQLVVFCTLVCPSCVAQPGLCSSRELQTYGEEATAEDAVKSIGTLERQHCHLGFLLRRLVPMTMSKASVSNTSLIPRQDK